MQIPWYLTQLAFTFLHISKEGIPESHLISILPSKDEKYFSKS